MLNLNYNNDKLTNIGVQFVDPLKDKGVAGNWSEKLAFYSGNKSSCSLVDLVTTLIIYYIPSLLDETLRSVFLLWI